MSDRDPYIPRTTLPEALPIFPLPGALILPGGQLPLNIFEPRYLRMVDDALSGVRLIGMIQPAEESQEGARPPLFDVGCAGRITAFSETGDGRYLITLTGVRRFRMVREEATDAPYRIVTADWEAYESDGHKDDTGATIDREAFLDVMREYLEAEGLKTDWEAAENAPIEALIASLAMGCPFEVNEKQALLEARTVADRAACLMALMEMSGAAGPDGDQRMQ